MTFALSRAAASTGWRFSRRTDPGFSLRSDSPFFMFLRSVLSQGIRFLLPGSSGGRVGARLETEAVDTGFKDVAVVS